jgi:hypothetical protein
MDQQCKGNTTPFTFLKLLFKKILINENCGSPRGHWSGAEFSQLSRADIDAPNPLKQRSIVAAERA